MSAEETVALAVALAIVAWWFWHGQTGKESETPAVEPMQTRYSG